MDETRIKKTDPPKLWEYQGRKYWQPDLCCGPVAIDEEEKTGIRDSKAQMARSKAFEEEEYRKRARRYAQTDETRIKKTYSPKLWEY